jgi:NSS family neurotransmitter:Na+ symporter
VVFSNHLEPGMGPGLIFETLPLAFMHMPGGALFGTIFFVLVFFAAITSAIALIEPAVAWLSENKGFDRVTASIYAGAGCWLLGVGTVLSFNLWSEKSLLGKTFFDAIDFLTADILLPIGGILVAIFAGWIMNRSESADELELGGLYAYWLLLTRFVAPAAVAIILLHGLGLF